MTRKTLYLKSFPKCSKRHKNVFKFSKVFKGKDAPIPASVHTLQLCSPQFKFVGTGPKLLSIFKTFEDDFRKVRLLFGVSKRDKCHNFKCIFLKAERKISWFQEHSSWSISFPLRYLTKSGHYLQCKPSKRIWTACYLGLIISNSLGLACEQVQIFAVIWTVEKCTKSFWLKLFLTM